MKRLVFVTMLLIVSTTIWFGCKEEETTGSISGVVIDKATGESIGNAGVELKPTGKKTATGNDGLFEFVEIEPGEYTLYATNTGYNDSESSKIMVNAGQVSHCDIQMEKLPYVVLNTLPATEVKTTSAKFNGVITDAGSFTERGFVYSESSMPTLENTIHRLTAPITEETTYSAIATGLTFRKTYYVRAYATNAAGTSYSTNQVTVIPDYALPSVTTNAVSNINLSNGTATLNGTIDDMGDSIYTERGFAYGTNSNPSIDTDTKKIVMGTGIGPFHTNITELHMVGTYYVRAYAINNAGISYGEEVSFNFNAVAATVTTLAPTNKNITNGTAIFNGKINNAGEPAYTEKGFVYATSPNPNIEGNTKKIVAGSGTGEYSVSVNNLVMGNTYYIRAYVINAGVVHYGAEQTLDFSAVQPTITIQATNVQITNGNSISATLNGSITDVGDPAYTERGFVYGTIATPTIYDATVVQVSGTSIGAFSTHLSGLPLEDYYVRAYAKNNNANYVAYSEPINLQVVKLCVGCGPGSSNLWVAATDAPGTYQWGPDENLTNATSISDGVDNMNTIMAIETNLNSYPAFKACNDMGDGWYLPSKNELNSLYEHKNAIGSFSRDSYWSSTEYNSNSSWNQHLGGGAQYNEYWKSYNFRVRCVRRVE